MSITTAVPVSEDELRAFVVEHGGKWSKLFGSNLERDGGQIVISLETRMWKSFDETEMLEEEKELGFTPKALIVLEVFRSENGRQDRAAVMLAQDIAKEMAQLWKGLIDWSDVDPPTDWDEKEFWEFWQ